MVKIISFLVHHEGDKGHEGDGFYLDSQTQGSDCTNPHQNLNVPAPAGFIPSW